MPTYEAIYEDGQLEWIGDEPSPGRHRVQVRVLDRESESRDLDGVQRILDESHGAWGADKSVEDIDEEIDKMRSDWDRPWYDVDRE